MKWLTKKEQTAAEAAAAQEKIPLTHRLWAKIIAFILVVVMVPLFIGSCLGAVAMWEMGVYTTSESRMMDTMLENTGSSMAFTAASAMAFDTIESTQHYWVDNSNVAGLEITMTGARTGNYSIHNGSVSPHYTYSYEWIFVDDSNTGDQFVTHPDALTPQGYASEDIQVSNITVKLSLPAAFSMGDEFYLGSLLVRAVYALRIWIYPMAFFALALAIASFVFLMCATGKRKGLAGPQLGWGTKVPSDLLTVGAGFAGFFLLQAMVETTYGRGDVAMVALFALFGVCLEVLCLGWLMSMVLRLKLHTLWRNSVIYYVLRLCGRLLRKVGHAIQLILGGTPTMKRTVAIAVVVVLADGFFTAINNYSDAMPYWLLRAVIVLALTVLATLGCRRLYAGGKALAEGDLNHKIDTHHLYGPLKSHAEHLNAIGDGMTVAVEQRLKSERMKTELITNVSHDIKTPLTSIINYTDLIEKEPCDNEKITEYANVLHRQSDRLKRLIEDLVEASKASTGNLEMQLAPCTVNILLGQTLAEFEEKLSASQLELMTNIEKNLEILADGRRLYRVFDNLMNNICKYAQPHTRVYVTARAVNGSAEIAFKNISNVPLNLTADELMERFVRGDASRHSEGNGLGLSIARSLTELQNGKMELSVDGDLFKVVLTFPLLSQ